MLGQIARDAQGSPVGMALEGVGGWGALGGLRGPPIWGDRLERGRERAEEGPCEEERRIISLLGLGDNQREEESS